MPIQLQVYNVKYQEAQEEHPPLRWTRIPVRDALSEDTSLGTVVYLNVVADRCIHSKTYERIYNHTTLHPPWQRINERKHARPLSRYCPRPLNIHPPSQLQ